MLRQTLKALSPCFNKYQKLENSFEKNTKNSYRNKHKQLEMSKALISKFSFQQTSKALNSYQNKHRKLEHSVLTNIKSFKLKFQQISQV